MNSDANVLNTILNSQLNKINNNRTNIKTVMKYTDFNFMSLYDLMDLFSIPLSFGISSTKCLSHKNERLFIKSIEKDKHVLIQMLFPFKEDFNANSLESELYDIVLSYDGIFFRKKDFNKGLISITILFDKN